MEAHLEARASEGVERGVEDQDDCADAVGEPGQKPEVLVPATIESIEASDAPPKFTSVACLP